MSKLILLLVDPVLLLLLLLKKHHLSCLVVLLELLELLLIVHHLEGVLAVVYLSHLVHSWEKVFHERVHLLVGLRVHLLRIKRNFNRVLQLTIGSEMMRFNIDIFERHRNLSCEISMLLLNCRC